MSSFEEQGIAALKIRVNKLEAQLDYVYKHLGITFVEEPLLMDDMQVLEAIKSHNMIQAISLYREKTGVGLAEAKFGVEAIRKRLGI